MDQPENITESSGKLDIGVKVQANLDPIVNATPQGLSTLFSLLFKGRYTNAARQAALSAAQNFVDAQKILEGKAAFNQESGALVETHAGRNEIRELVREIVQEEEITNLISCTIHAARNIEEGEGNSETNISSEFISRWRNEAKFISEDAAQEIWGKILSEEIQAPNSISIRTLEVIKSVTREEADAFRDACKFVLFGASLVDSTTEGLPVSRSRYAMLKDAGLISNYTPGNYSSAPWLETTINFSDGPVEVYYLRAGKLFIYIEKSKIEKAPSTCIWMLTKAGREMHNIVSRDLQYDLESLAKSLIANNESLSDHMLYTLYTDINKNIIDFDAIKKVF